MLPSHPSFRPFIEHSTIFARLYSILSERSFNPPINDVLTEYELVKPNDDRTNLPFALHPREAPRARTPVKPALLKGELGERVGHLLLSGVCGTGAVLNDPRKSESGGGEGKWQEEGGLVGLRNLARTDERVTGSQMEDVQGKSVWSHFRHFEKKYFVPDEEVY